MDKVIVFNESMNMSESLCVSKERKGIIKNYKALTISIIITITALYTFVFDSNYLTNIIISTFLGFLDVIAFFFAIIKYHNKETITTR